MSLASTRRYRRRRDDDDDIHHDTSSNDDNEMDGKGSKQKKSRTEQLDRNHHETSSSRHHHRSRSASDHHRKSSKRKGEDLIVRGESKRKEPKSDKKDQDGEEYDAKQNRKEEERKSLRDQETRIYRDEKEYRRPSYRSPDRRRKGRSPSPYYHSRRYHSPPRRRYESPIRDGTRKPSPRRRSLRRVSNSPSKRRRILSSERRHKSRSPHHRRLSNDRLTKRSWRFDSPPRETGGSGPDSYGSGVGIIPGNLAGPLSVNGVPGMISSLLSGDAPPISSPMSVMAQSLGLTVEQQKGARELYVGNLPPNFDVNQLIDYFNAALQTVKVTPWPGNPVVRAWIASNENHFGFIEFRTIEEATLALQLNGSSCLGYALRVGRPKTYPSEYTSLISALPVDVPGIVGPPTSPAAALAAATAAASAVGQNYSIPGIGSTSLPSAASAMMAAQAAAAGIGMPRRLGEGASVERPDRLVILDLPCSKEVSEEEIRKLLAGYGSLKVFQYFEVPTSKGCADQGVCIFEYTDMAGQRSMKSALEHRRVGGQKLRLVTAEEAIGEGRLSKVMQKATDAGRNLKEELGGDLMRPQIATRCIMLTNLVTREELHDDKEYYEIVDDVNLECSEFCKVLHVEIPRPIPRSKPGEFDESDVGYAFVEFSTIEGAGVGRKSLSGRKFAGRTVEAHYFSEIHFRDRKFKNPRPNFDPMHSSANNPELLPKIEENEKDEERENAPDSKEEQNDVLNGSNDENQADGYQNGETNN